tara:strand:- start:8869 stop:10104 length:1236 start_codon:yes stop_codon:yes gene_type:complete
MEFRDYQLEIIDKGVDVIKKYDFVYLAMEVRTGKTLTSLGICDKLGATNVLFVTKKKAIGSIEGDHKMFNPKFAISVINYESLHKIDVVNQIFDVVILDEAHGLGAFPKKSKRCDSIRRLVAISKAKVILLSGTPTPESYSQIYHQVNFIPKNPFKQFVNFYKFAQKYVDVKQRKINSFFINDYSCGKKEILDIMKPYMISYSQKEAGFVVQTDEEILYVDIKQETRGLIRKITKDLVIEGKDEVVLADTPVKLMTKVHQLCSGTIKFESGRSMVVDYTKAEYICEKFKDQKIGIFYKFKEELAALKKVFDDDLCTDLETFNSTSKSIALQIVSGREGISLRKAEALVYYNIDFSATSYWQSRDRMTTKDRLHNKIYWVFSKGGIEDDIYKAVVKKKDYTLNHFKKDLLNL